MFCKKDILIKISQNSQENICARFSFLIKLQLIKEETLAQVFSYEFWEISKNTFFYRTPPVGVSEKTDFRISKVTTLIL